MRPQGQYITIGAAARRLGWTDFRLLRHVATERLRVKRAGRHTLIRLADVERLATADAS